MNRVLRGMLVLAVWLVIGASSVYALTWGIVRAGYEPTVFGQRWHWFATRWNDGRDAPERWPFQRIDGWPPTSWKWSENRVQRLDHAEWAVVPYDASVDVSTCGFPFPALRTMYAYHHYVQQRPASVWNSGWTVSTSESTCVTLPLRPAWPGFAINTLLYAALAWSLWQVPLSLRRRHRRAHNRCLRCGYSLAGLASGAPCPECGRGAKAT